MKKGKFTAARKMTSMISVFEGPIMIAKIVIYCSNNTGNNCGIHIVQTYYTSKQIKNAGVYC